MSSLAATLASPHILGPLFGLSEFGLLLAKRSRAGAAAADDGSLALLWSVILCSIALATLAGNYLRGANSAVLITLAPLALLLCIGALLLRWYAIVYLGRFFTVNVAIASDHRLIDSGPYRYIRHPSYTGALLAFLGLGIAYGNLVSLALMVVPTSLAFMRRIRIEERALTRAFGERYLLYMARTKRLVPGLY